MGWQAHTCQVDGKTGQETMGGKWKCQGRPSLASFPAGRAWLAQSPGSGDIIAVMGQWVKWSCLGTWVFLHVKYGHRGRHMYTHTHTQGKTHRQMYIHTYTQEPSAEMPQTINYPPYRWGH